MLRTILVAVPALSRVEPAMTSGADGRRDHEVDERLQLGARVAGDEDDLRAGPARAVQPAADERRHAARRHADDDVFRRRAEPGERARALFVVVLDALARTDEGPVPAGHHGAHQVGIGAEGRRHLGRFEHAKAAAGAGADEHQTPALPQRLADDFDAQRDSLLFLRNRRDDLAVFVDHEVDNRRRRELVNGQAGRIDRFGWQLLPLRLDRHDETSLRGKAGMLVPSPHPVKRYDSARQRQSTPSPQHSVPCLTPDRSPVEATRA